VFSKRPRRHGDRAAPTATGPGYDPRPESTNSARADPGGLQNNRAGRPGRGGQATGAAEAGRPPRDHSRPGTPVESLTLSEGLSYSVRLTKASEFPVYARFRRVPLFRHPSWGIARPQARGGSAPNARQIVVGGPNPPN